jgi:hypothetical protein
MTEKLQVKLNRSQKRQALRILGWRGAKAGRGKRVHPLVAQALEQQRKADPTIPNTPPR